MKIEQFLLYNLLGIALVLCTHELGHFLMARLLGYPAELDINLFKLKFITIVHNLENPKHQKLIACSGCLFTTLCVLILRVLRLNQNFISFCIIYTLIFFLNLHPRFPDGKIFWQ